MNVFNQIDSYAGGDGLCMFRQLFSDELPKRLLGRNRLDVLMTNGESILAINTHKI